MDEISIYYSHWYFKAPWMKPYNAVCFGRTILFRFAEKDVSAKLHNHEMVHQAQMDRHGVWGFYVRYFWHYCKGLLKYRNHKEAYYRNPFEVEAYAKQGQ